MSDQRQYDTIPEQALKLGRVGSWAPGRYMCQCVRCERRFEGDKRAVVCLPCAVAGLEAELSRLQSLSDQNRLTGGAIDTQRASDWLREWCFARFKRRIFTHTADEAIAAMLAASPPLPLPGGEEKR